MPLTVTRSRVKEKCGIGDTEYDTAIDNLIAELVPVIEHELEAAALGDAEILTALNLGATEIVCAEFVLQVAREPGASEGFNLNGVELFSRKAAQDAESLRTQADARLAPYRRSLSRVVSVPRGETTE
ncbi:MAG TPA: hypothetical protein VGE01_09715 [Fimbriimonas sp.]